MVPAANSFVVRFCEGQASDIAGVDGHSPAERHTSPPTK